MSTKEAGLSSSEAVTLKAMTGVGLAVFSLFMFANWQKLLSQAKLAEEAQPQEVATQASSTPSTATSVSTTSSTAPSSVTTPANTVTSVSSTQPATPSASSTEAAPSETLVASTTSSGTDATTIATSVMPEESTPEITDTAVIQNLNQQLYDKVDQAWQAMPTFSQDLVYQVVVQEDGDIVEYDPLNPAAANFLKDVPIDELSDEKAATPSESVAKFLVVMTPNGKLEVSPWAGKN